MMILLLLCFPLLAGLIVLAAGERLAARLALFFSVLELGFTGWALTKFYQHDHIPFNFYLPWIENPEINIHLSIDGLSFVLIALTNLLIPVIVLSAFNRTIKHAAAFFCLILIMQFALLGVFMAMDGLVYYIFWELALIPIYFISLIWGGAKRVAVTVKFFIYTLAGSLLMLLGLILLYWYNPYHSFSIEEFYALMLDSKQQGWLFWMFFLAFAIKIPIVPFHTWQPDTYREAPTQGTMLLSGIMLKMGIYSVLRWLIPVLPMGVKQWGPLAITLCVIGIVYASFIAMRQRNLKNLLAYSSIAHVGLISAGVFAMNIQSFQGSVVQMVAHGINVVGLFLCADILFHRTGSINLDNLGGIRKLAPQFSTLFMIILLGSIALPLTNGFVGEFLLLYGVFEYNTWLAVFAGLTVILGAVYMLRMYKQVMLGPQGPRVNEFPDLLWNEKIALGVLALLVLFFGVYPKPILDLAGPTLDMLLSGNLITN